MNKEFDFQKALDADKLALVEALRFIELQNGELLREIVSLKKAASPDCICICGHKIVDHKCPEKTNSEKRECEQGPSKGYIGGNCPTCGRHDEMPPLG